MDTKHLSKDHAVSGQMQPDDLRAIAALGFRTVICNRPDNEDDAQPHSSAMAEAAQAVGLRFVHLPVNSPDDIDDSSLAKFNDIMADSEAPVLAYCRSGMRAATFWALSKNGIEATATLIKAVESAGHSTDKLRERLQPDVADTPTTTASRSPKASYDVVIVGGGAGGIATASSILKRNPKLNVAIIEPTEEHYYQPGWTMVGGGIFTPQKTMRKMTRVMPKHVTWIKDSVTAFNPDANSVALSDNTHIGYQVLVASPGIKLNWDAIDGLSDTLGSNGVTSNYSIRYAPYTWELVQNLRSGKAVFTQPPMPIKCAGAPQKAMYLSCNHWERQGRLKDIKVSFHNAGPVLFGVSDYVPALESYVKRYHIDLNFKQTLVAVDGPAKKAWFDVNGGEKRIEVDFDMLHVCPAQSAPDFVRNSALANEAGWIEVSPETLQHTRFPNVFGLGDACSTPNAKTAAAVRKQAPVVAQNVSDYLAQRPLTASYDGYGSCPLTVERGKVVLAEFGYGGKLLPSAPAWLLDGTKPSRLAWILKADLLPSIYFDAMLKGREWFAAPGKLQSTKKNGSN